MFRRRPAKRGAPGFARSRDDITALGDSFGDMLTSPVRDAPPKARAASLPGLELPQPQSDAEPPREDRPRPRAQAPSQGQWRRSAAPDQAARLPRRAQRGKEFRHPPGGARRQHLCPPRRGGRPVGSERRRQDHGVLHDHRADQGRSRRHRTRRPRRDQAADVSARAARHRLSAAGSLDLPRPHRRAEYSRRARGRRAQPQEARGRTQFAAR